MANLPPPPANPVEVQLLSFHPAVNAFCVRNIVIQVCLLCQNIGTKARLLLKSAPAERFSVTHHHMPERAVDREPETEQVSDSRYASLSCICTLHFTVFL